jgi:DNA-binding NarL/FixJ family response regulator
VVNSAVPRIAHVLLVELDGGGARVALAASPLVRLRSVDSLEAARLDAQRVRPDVIVIAWGDPGTRAVQDFKLLTRTGHPPLLVISRPLPEHRVTELIKAGAAGYLFAEDAHRLPAAVHEMLRGGVPMSPPVSRLVMGRARRSSSQMAAVRPPTVNVTDIVTDRQREILNLLANGHSYDDIGTALDLSVNTVRSHVRMLYERLGVSTKVEAVVVALELGIVERPPSR